MFIVLPTFMDIGQLNGVHACASYSMHVIEGVKTTSI